MKRKIVVSSVIFVLFIMLFQVMSFAETTGTINFKAECEGIKISNVKVAIYKVGVLNNGKFEFSESFKNCNLDKENLSKENITNFEKYAVDNNVDAMEIRTTDDNGSFKLTDLELGTYLIVQNDSKDYCTMQTMLIDIPEVTSERGINYIINAEPKISLKYPHGGEEEEIIIKEPELPYTGVLSWPIPVLAVSGILIFAAAWLVFYTKKKVK